jgi:hypothetical protein
MARKFDLGRALLAAGAALLLVSLFLEWYDVSVTGWEVFEALDLILAAIAGAALYAALAPDAVPRWLGWALPVAAVVIVGVQLLDPPPAAGDGDPSSGAWLALAGALLMAAGAALSIAAISVTVQVHERELRRRMTAVDRREGAGSVRDERIVPREPPADGVRADDRTQPIAAHPEEQSPSLLAKDPAPERTDRPERA